ncbi:UPF0481 protein At3g47200 [Oryza sativa Japonica Group]|uniref:Os11g0543300 protein n=3 Tax=Oryza TaxID=4527 RepID=Q0ISA9_ORYSJ|nr:UPF0481 protein At3g47200 [Oryza sativa Japonica Group]ABA94149.1 hypothetical protein LOC_Os11g34090 [Oryza sativa Japonica Group]BAF28406.1 Os11g0543300 [Oryza sativa Japonica Group]|eukprot:NP_001068043.1 Os11g0543300 [Oryza sativa Japonica Group]
MDITVAGGAGDGGERRTWVVEVERTLHDAPDAAAEASRWRPHCIYRVPACIKDLKPKAYQPQVVSLGPFHHGDPGLAPMEEHKRRALRHLLRRAARPLADFVAAVEAVADRLEAAYLDLGGGWRGGGGDGGEARERFLEMMIVDGCFLLEVMRAAAAVSPATPAPAAAGKPHAAAEEDYAENDPVFSRHGVLYMVPYIRRDMLMLENQLPLLVLERLLFVETERANVVHSRVSNEDHINRMVLRFLSPSARTPALGTPLGHHPLDALRRSMLHGEYQSPRWGHGAGARAHHRDIIRPAAYADDGGGDIIRSAVELYEAGIRFRRARTDSLHDVRFRHGVLAMPPVAVDDSTEYMLLNMMAFERLHPGAGNDVTAYVFFMDSIIDSAKDVALLSSKGIIQNAVGSDKAVAKLFNSISKDVVLEPESALDGVQRQVNAYCRQPWNMWRANLIHTYFRSPWAFMSLAAAMFLLVMTIMQTVYTVMSFYQQAEGGGGGGSAAPSPM